MTIYVDAYLGSPKILTTGLASAHGILFDAMPATVPSGALRIGGDSPFGLVLAGGVPASRVVDVFTRDTVNDPPILLHVLRTTSAGDGTYNLAGLAARTQGYDICLRGVISSGERDVWVPGVHPG